MAKKAARRNGGRTSMTASQKKKRKRLQHFNFEAKLGRRTHIDGWEDKLSLRRNYKNLGIAFNANAILSKPNEAFEDSAHQLVPEKTGVLTERLEYLQSLPPPAPYEVKSMNVQEQYQLQRLIAAHAGDYEAMQADLKLNINQMTATKLQKRIELMFRLQNATNSSPAPRRAAQQQGDEDFEDEDFDDEDFEDEDGEEEEGEEEEEEEEAVDAEAIVPQVDTTGLDDYAAMRAEKQRKRTIQRINEINHKKELNKRFRSGLSQSKFGSKIVVPGLSQLVNTRGTKKKQE